MDGQLCCVLTGQFRCGDGSIATGWPGCWRMLAIPAVKKVRLVPPQRSD
jgi:hypothetical protein